MSDVMGIGSLIGGMANAGANLYANYMTNATNKQIASQNLDFQYKNLDYLKQVQLKNWEREDTAIQRRMSDLRSAGLNPFAAANGNGAGSGAIIKTDAPQNNYHADYSGIAAAGNAIGYAVDMYKAFQEVKQNTLYTKYMELKNNEQELKNIDIGNSIWSDWLFELPVDYYDDGKRHYAVFDSRKGYEYPDNVVSSIMQTNPNFYGREENLMRIQHNLQQIPYTTDILKTQRDFAVSDKIESYIMDSINALVSGSGAANKWYDSYNKNTPLQNYQRDSYRDRNGVYHERKRYY